MLGEYGDAANRLGGALSATDAERGYLVDPRHEVDTRHDDEQRYRAVVSALLDVRPDHVGGYFDEALDAALAANRVDVHLARTLRWWQRASVRATEDFVTQIIPTVMAALDEADATAERDAAANAVAWQQAQAIAELSASTPSGSDSDGDGADDGASADVTWRPAVRLVAVPELPEAPVRRATRVRATQMPDFDAPVADVSIDEIDSMLTFEREGSRGHAHPASSA